MPRDPDSKYKCIWCNEIVGDQFYYIEHGRAEYIDKLDMMCFDEDKHESSKRCLCTSCTTDVYVNLIDHEDEISEQALQWDTDYQTAEDMLYENLSYGIISVPLTWFSLGQEPDICCACRDTIDDRKRMVQISLVARDGRKISAPISHVDGIRYTFFCESCLDHTYKLIKEFKECMED